MSMALYNLGLGLAPQSNVVRTQDEVMKQAQQRAADIANGYEYDRDQATQNYTNYLTGQAQQFYGDAVPQAYVQKMAQGDLGAVNQQGSVGDAANFMNKAGLGGAFFWNPESVVGQRPDTSGLIQTARGQIDQMNQSHQIQQQAYDGILNGGGFGGGVINGGTTTSMFGTPMNSGAGTSGAWGGSGGFGGLGGLGGFGQAGQGAQQPQQTWGGPFSVQNPWAAK